MELKTMILRMESSFVLSVNPSHEGCVIRVESFW